MTYRETIAYLDSFIDYEKILPDNYGRAFGLGRMERLLVFLGKPHKNIRAVHVAGTKGKGSTAAIIASILRQAGLTVGLYTSPHLISFRERITINGVMITEGDISRIITDVKVSLEKMRGEGISFFEICTALAFLYFREKEIDIAVLETGLGGRLDATNVIESIVSVITPISREHMRVLGDDIACIAREKAAIIKKGSICVSAPQEDKALKVIFEACKDKEAGMSLVGRDIYIDSAQVTRDVQCFNVWSRFTEYPLIELKLRGAHQMINAAVAIGAVDALRRVNIFVGQGAVRKGISGAKWPGRIEVVSEYPLVVVDGAQNGASAKALTEAIKRHFKFNRLILILGILRDKDIAGVSAALSKTASAVILTRVDNPRSADPDRIRYFMKDKPCEVIPDPKTALEIAYSKAEDGDLILAAGSLYLVGAIKRILS